ncbi:LysM peptidoglycan-binding domain-containing protein [Enterobacter roggenkampii]|uniref:LysM peptidoglycan-binding domain-containing protein n=1 Tax=Enterobacter roggenkampii TaxID=1812935 RepID=UPI0032AFD6EB
MNILIQLLYPVISLATPSNASADEAHLMNQGVVPLKLKTNAYTLAEGESVSSVANKYHLTLEQLRELISSVPLPMVLIILSLVMSLTYRSSPCRKFAGNKFRQHRTLKQDMNRR